MNRIKLPSFVLLISLFWCCEQKSSDEIENIRLLLKQEQKAHLTEDVDLFTSVFADGMISVSRGELMQSTPDEHRERFRQYFNNVEFIKWEDTEDPIIRLSEDQTLGYALVQKRVIVIRQGAVLPDTTDFAWISVLRKQGGVWKTECNVSTEKPK